MVKIDNGSEKPAVMTITDDGGGNSHKMADTNLNDNMSVNKHTIFKKEKNILHLKLITNKFHTFDLSISEKHKRNSCIGPECHRCCCFLYASYDSGSSQRH